MRTDHVHRTECITEDLPWCRRFAPQQETVGLARRLIQRACVAAGVDSETLELLISEVATNAVQHAGSYYEVSCIFECAGLRIEVRDFSPALPVVRDAEDDDEGGRGLLLVDVLADHHVEKLPDGKVFCFRQRENPAWPLDEEEKVAAA